MEITIVELGAVAGVVTVLFSPIYIQIYRLSSQVNARLKEIGDKLDIAIETSNRALTIVELCPSCPHRHLGDELHD